MKKKLRQERFFNKLYKNKISINTYVKMLRFYVTQDVKELPEKYHNNKDKVIKFIEQCDQLFLQQKKIPVDELLGVNYKDKINMFIELFPKGKLPNGKYARSNAKNIENNFVWFFNTYNYNWKIILNATELYVEEYKKNNYKFMRTAYYFIKKIEQDKSVICDLADYCDRIVNNDDYREEKHFKTKVI